MGNAAEFPNNISLDNYLYTVDKVAREEAHQHPRVVCRDATLGRLAAVSIRQMQKNPTRYQKLPIAQVAAIGQQIIASESKKIDAESFLKLEKISKVVPRLVDQDASKDRGWRIAKAVAAIVTLILFPYGLLLLYREWESYQESNQIKEKFTVDLMGVKSKLHEIIEKDIDEMLARLNLYANGADLRNDKTYIAQIKQRYDLLFKEQKDKTSHILNTFKENIEKWFADKSINPEQFQNEISEVEDLIDEEFQSSLFDNLKAVEQLKESIPSFASELRDDITPQFQNIERILVRYPNNKINRKLEQIRKKLASFEKDVQSYVEKTTLDNEIIHAFGIALNDRINAFDTKLEKIITETVKEWGVLAVERENILRKEKDKLKQHHHAKISEYVQKSSAEPSVDDFVERNKTEFDLKLSGESQKKMENIEDRKRQLQDSIKDKARAIRETQEREITRLHAIAEANLPADHLYRKHAEQSLHSMSPEELGKKIMERISIDLPQIDVQQALKEMIQRLMIVSDPKLTAAIKTPIILRYDRSNFMSDRGLGYFLVVPKKELAAEENEKASSMEVEQPIIPKQVIKDLERGFYGHVFVYGKGDLLEFNNSSVENRDHEKIKEFCEKLNKKINEELMQKLLFINQQGSLANTLKLAIEKLNGKIDLSAIPKYNVVDAGQAITDEFKKTLHIVFDSRDNLFIKSREILSVKVTDPETQRKVDCLVVVTREEKITKGAFQKKEGEEFSDSDINGCESKYIYSPLFTSVQEANEYAAVEQKKDHEDIERFQKEGL